MSQAKQAPETAERVTRFEVIDHRQPDPEGRIVVAVPCRIELSYQDNGKTLKVFIVE